MRDKYALFANNWAYLLPSSDLHLASILSVDQSPIRVFLLNTQSVLYLLLNRRTALRRNFWVVFFSVLVAVGTLIPQRSLRSWVVTSICLSELWNVWVKGKSDLPRSKLGLYNSRVFIPEILLFIRSMLNKTSSFSIHMYESAPPLSVDRTHMPRGAHLFFQGPPRLGKIYIMWIPGVRQRLYDMSTFV